MRIGVLALQGGVIEHVQMIQRLGVETVQVRLPADLQHIDGLILPGGESTAIGRLMAACGLTEPIRQFGQGKAVWGSCAGMILMAQSVGCGPSYLRLMDITVERNAFGRQCDSFQSPVHASVFEDGRAAPFPGVFIRAPKLVGAGGQVRVIARLPGGLPAAAVEGKLLATAFHPELTSDSRFHQYFLSLAAG